MGVQRVKYDWATNTIYLYFNIFLLPKKVHTSYLSFCICMSIYLSVCLSSYWIGHKICSGFSIRCCEKLEQTFWPTQYLTSYWNIFFSLYTIWMTVYGPKVLQLLIFKEYNTALTLPYFVWRAHFLFVFLKRFILEWPLSSLSWAFPNLWY